MEPSSSCKEGRLSGGAISHGVALSVAALFCLLALDSMHATEPSWWTSRGAVNPSATRNDYAMANEGQLKQFTLEAVNEMNANFPPLGSGTGLNTLVGGWISDYATNGYSGSNPKPSDFQVVNVGQLKYIGGMIWTQLEAGGYTSSLPGWLVVTSSDSQSANLGQLKTVFDFDLTYSSDGSSLPDWWLIHYFGGLTVSGTTVNPSALVPWSGGQMTYLQAYQQGLNPVDFYNGQTPSLAMISGDNQSADYSVFLPNPLVVAVSIAGIGPVANAPVAFQSPSGGVSCRPPRVAHSPQLSMSFPARMAPLPFILHAPPRVPGRSPSRPPQASRQGPLPSNSLRQPLPRQSARCRRPAM